MVAGAAADGHARRTVQQSHHPTPFFPSAAFDVVVVVVVVVAGDQYAENGISAFVVHHAAHSVQCTWGVSTRGCFW